ncbi:MAG: 2-amino-4-hydroxy-6-hydroxymethyldihydropteridine diphosphokinase, partial [Nitrospirae bacterium]|nr:2-amino-4-hydroxy-6-hydroxymethyldihydropteridine diphosphokinase [Nitrospirota bacterium]
MRSDPVLSNVEGPVLSPARSGIEGAATVYLGLGANLGGPLETCALAVEAMRGERAFHALRRSSWYRTEPVGVAEQPWFVNLVVEAATSLTPRELLAYCRDLERALGRKHRLPGGPRELDMDLLLYG